MIYHMFKKFINEDKIEINPGVYVSLSVFESIFEGAETYDDFIKIDDNEKGYKRFFDECKKQGILN